MFYFNSHTPHGVRRCQGFEKQYQERISTHTPHTGCDTAHLFRVLPQTQFQLTHPTRGATCSTGLLSADKYISTHTPHTGCDSSSFAATVVADVFQLTHPTRGATLHIVKNRVATTKWSGPKQSFVYFSA